MCRAFISGLFRNPCFTMCKTTWRINEAVELIYALDTGFIKNETGQIKEDFDLSCLVPGMGQLSNHLFADFVTFSNLPGHPIRFEV